MAKTGGVKAGETRTGTTDDKGGMPEWPKGPGCKPGGFCLRRFESFSLHSCSDRRYGPKGEPGARESDVRSFALQGMLCGDEAVRSAGDMEFARFVRYEVRRYGVRRSSCTDVGMRGREVQSWVTDPSGQPSPPEALHPPHPSRGSMGTAGAGVTQLVECQPSKLKVASSNLVSRSLGARGGTRGRLPQNRKTARPQDRPGCAGSGRRPGLGPGCEVRDAESRTLRISLHSSVGRAFPW